MTAAHKPQVKFLLDLLLAGSALVLSTTALVSIGFDALVTLNAIAKLNQKSELRTGQWDITAKRLIQKELLAQKVYVPTDMILTASDFKGLLQDGVEFTKLVKNLCPLSHVEDRFVLVPLTFTIPFYGTLVKDWCWAPSHKRGLQ